MDTTLIHPTVSVILPVYNGGPYLATAIKSVLDQTYSQFELLIIDDGSTDTSVATIREFSDPRIILIQHTQNRKLIATLNEGLSLARGKYIARIDSDDIWNDKDKLAKQMNFLEKNPSYALVGTQGIAINNADKKLFTLRYPCTDESIRRKLLIKNCFIHSSVVFNKEIALTCQGFLPAEKHAEDYGLWLRIGEKMKFANLTDVAVHYRVNTAGVTQQNNQAQIEMCLSIINEHKDRYPNYTLGKFKWKIKLFITKLLGTTTFERIKRTTKS